MSSVEDLRDFLRERLTAAAEEIFGVLSTTIVGYEEEIDRQRKLLDVVLKTDRKLHRIEPSQQDVSQEEVLADQQLCIQERNSSLDQEDPEPPRVKEEQEEPCSSQFVLKHETDAFMLTPTYEESDETLNPDLTLSAAEKETVVNMPVILSVVSEAHSDHQLLSHNSQDEHGDSGLTGNAEQKPKKTGQKRRHHIINHKKPQNHCKTQRAKNSIKCDICGKDFTQKSALQVHMRNHTDVKQYSCKTCGKDFRLKNSFYVHMRTHTDVKPYSCKTCGKDFTRKYNLFVHIKTHTDGKLYSCNTCGKDFVYSRSLVVHMRTHTGERPYSCNTCEKSFSQIQHLKKHMQIHTGVKPYSCKTCGKHFRHSFSLKVHMRIHTGEKPYSCKTCGKDFRHNVCLKSHMRKIHTDEKAHICKS